VNCTSNAKEAGDASIVDWMLQASQQWRETNAVLSKITSATDSASKVYRKRFSSIGCIGTNFAHEKGDIIGTINYRPNDL